MSPSEKSSHKNDQLSYINLLSPGSPLQSSSGSFAALILLGFIGGALISTVSPRYKEDIVKEKSDSKEHTTSFFPIGILPRELEVREEMAGQPLPGRPGSLTEHEEEKLREFWIATLQVFGVLDAKDLNGNADVEVTPGVTRADTKKPKKKSRMSVFRSKGKDKDNDTSDASSVVSAAPVGAADDKYGQTQEFHEAIASLSPETLRTTFWSMVKHDHPDALLLRFLRARKWDVEKALIMMVSTMRWRSKDMHVDDDIMKNGELGAIEDAASSDPERKKLGQDFLDQMRMGKSFLHGLDKNGRPMCFVRARLHKAGEQSEASLERYTVFLIESARMVVPPPIDTAVSPEDFPNLKPADLYGSALFLTLRVSLWPTW